MNIYNVITIQLLSRTTMKPMTNMTGMQNNNEETLQCVCTTAYDEHPRICCEQHDNRDKVLMINNMIVMTNVE